MRVRPDYPPRRPRLRATVCVASSIQRATACATAACNARRLGKHVVTLVRMKGASSFYASQTCGNPGTKSTDLAALRDAGPHQGTREAGERDRPVHAPGLEGLGQQRGQARLSRARRAVRDRRAAACRLRFRMDTIFIDDSFRVSAFCHARGE